MSVGKFERISVDRGELYLEFCIKNFNKKIDATWESPKFGFAGTEWSIVGQPRIMCDSVKYVAVSLMKSKTLNSTDRGACSIGITGFYNDTVEGTYSANEKCEILLLIPRVDLVRDICYIDDDYANFFCKICPPSGCKMDANHQTSLFEDFRALSQNYKTLFLSERGSDVTIRVKGQNFRAHSLILTTRSPVFATMFSHDMKEKNTGVVDVEDCEPDVFREFLLFLYSGQAESITTDNVTGMYNVAEKYDMKNLKAICTDFMKEEMNVDIFGEVVSAAVTHGDAELIQSSMEFFVRNMKEIVKSAKWISFATEHPVKASEFIINAVDTSDSLK